MWQLPLFERGEEVWRSAQLLGSEVVQLLRVENPRLIANTPPPHPSGVLVVSELLSLLTAVSVDT